jgi:RimJ/RimL family protein N-acetyltransferase
MAEVIFETDRLIARRLVAGDEKAMCAIYGDPEVVVFVGDSRPLPEEICKHWIDVTDKNFILRGYGMVAFVERSSGELIGCGGIVHPDQQPEPEVKYAFRKDVWGVGFATEAVSALIKYAVQTLGIGRIVATIAPGNMRSRRVISKVGFLQTSDRINEDATATQIWEYVRETP